MPAALSSDPNRDGAAGLPDSFSPPDSFRDVPSRTALRPRPPRPSMPDTRSLVRAGCLALGLAVSLSLLASPAAAHDSPEFMVGVRAPIPASIVLTPTASTGFTSSGVALVGLVPLPEFGGATGADCWGYTSGSGREYALMTTRSSMSFVEITDPGRPQIVATLPAVNSLWRDVKTYQTYAYWVSEGGDGVQIADMSQIDNGIVTYIGGVFDAGTDASHNVAIDVDAGFLYRTGGGGGATEGLRIFSLANPAAPVFVGSWNTRYVHDAQIVRYTSGPFANQEIAFCYSEDTSGGGNPGVDILNVTNKGAIVSIGDAFYGSAVFSHQGWLSPDRQYLYLNDELDERAFGTPTTTHVLDVSDLTDPTPVASFSAGLPSIDHNLYTKGDLIFEANYRSGMRVFDASNPTSPVETAWFDTFPEDDAAEFNGIWSVYPYFDSGTVIGSDAERGLFVWRLGARELDLTVSGGAPTLIDPDGEPLTVAIAAAGGATLDVATARLHVDSGAGSVEVPLADIGGGEFAGSFPALACGTAVEWFVSARTTGGITWTDPPAAPGFAYGATAAVSEAVLIADDLEVAPAWSLSAPGDTAFTGLWIHADPIATAAQPEDDHSDPGSQCFVTGQGSPLGSLGENDVDGGATTLTTIDYDLSGGDATISYWRWFSNAAGSSTPDDSFTVDISNDGGSGWTNVEVIGPGDEAAFGGWYRHSFLVSDLVTPTATVRLRFVAEDANDASIVEAAVDDLRITRFDCGTCQTDVGFAGPGSAIFSVCGDGLESGDVSTLKLENAAPNAGAVLFAGFTNNPTPFLGGDLVPVPFFVQVVLVTDGNGEVEFPVNGGGGPLSVFAQIAILDAGVPYGVAVSNALRLDFGP